MFITIHIFTCWHRPHLRHHRCRYSRPRHRPSVVTARLRHRPAVVTARPCCHPVVVAAEDSVEYLAGFKTTATPLLIHQMIHREKGHRDKKRRGGRKGHKGWGQGARETGTGSGPGKRDSGKGGVGAGVVAKGLTTLSS